jgi:hypothetical protein
VFRGPRTRRFARTVSQFGQLRLQVAGAIAVVLLILGVAAVDPQSTAGVVLISLGTGVLTSTLVAAIALEREDFAQSVLGLGVQNVFADRSRTFDNQFWRWLIETAKHRFAVLGVANHGYLRNPLIGAETQKAIEEAVKRKVDVEILWLNPESDLARFREESEGERGLRDDTVRSIAFFWDLREGLQPPAKERLRLAEHNVMPTCGITWSDDVMIVTHYLARELNLESPGLVLGPSMSLADRIVERARRSSTDQPPLTEVYTANFRQIAASSTELTGERVAHLRQRVGTWGPDSAARKSESEIRRERGIDDPDATDSSDG